MWRLRMVGGPQSFPRRMLSLRSVPTGILRPPYAATGGVPDSPPFVVLQDEADLDALRRAGRVAREMLGRHIRATARDGRLQVLILAKCCARCRGRHGAAERPIKECVAQRINKFALEPLALCWSTVWTCKSVL